MRICTRPPHLGFKEWWSDHKAMMLFGISGIYDYKPWWSPRRYKACGLIPELWYYLKCRVWKRYNVVRVKTLQPTYTDPMNILLHASFAVLEDLIFEERIFDRTADDGDPNDGKSWAWALKEMEELWHWWTVARFEREAEADRRLDLWVALDKRDVDAYSKLHGTGWETEGLVGCYRWRPEEHYEQPDTEAAWEATRELDDRALDAEATEMLVRLAKVRQYMWT